MTLSTETFDYWTLLGVSPGSDSEEIKNGFKKEAMKWHPDLNKNNEIALERFKLVSQAYGVLSNPQKRSRWEIAGRPPVELKIFPKKVDKKIPSKESVKVSSNPGAFNTSERLLIILISIFLLFLTDTFIL